MKFFEELEETPECNLQLKDLIIECLNNDLKKRPSSEQVMNQLEDLKRDNEVGDPCPEDIQKAAGILKEAEKGRIKKVSDKLLPLLCK